MMQNKLQVLKFLNKDIYSLKIAVIGDMMLDRYYFGEVKRISPEAPVPVNRIVKATSCLGGAGNVANNLARLGVKVFAGGIAGLDLNKDLLLSLMQDVGINTQGIIVSPERETITKLRVIGGSQQMLRLDFEQVGLLSLNELNALQDWLDNLLSDGLDAIIISDYAKGVCTPEFCQYVIKQAHYKHVPVLVDPKGSNWDKYSNCDFITPNVKEMGDAVGIDLANNDEDVLQAANEAIGTYNIANVVVTRSEQGLSFVSRNFIYHDKATAREVFDVSGAGDTMAATFMAAIAGGLNLTDCLKLANWASGIVVGKVGTQPVVNTELLTLVADSDKYGINSKVLTTEQAQAAVEYWQKSGRKVIFTNGCFDILHLGHVQYLSQARELGDRLIVGLNSDSSVQRLKGQTRPLVPQEARAGLLAALACVDAVVIFAEDTPELLLSKLRPDVLVKGGDYTVDTVLGKEYVQEVKLLTFVDGYSTTNIVETISKLAKEGKI